VSDGATIPRIYNGDIESVEIPLPSLPIQRQIVTRLSTAKARAEKLEAKAREGVAICETMRKAILKEAFSPFAEALEDME
jgi:restriction endonuclease S subunit